jgi:hypothetical protein
MALLLSKNTTPIYVKGSDIELSEIYTRIIFTCDLDGSLTITYKTYLNYAAYLQGKEIATDLVNIIYNFVILETETQSLDTALLYMQSIFVDKGYNAVLV